MGGRLRAPGSEGFFEAFFERFWGLRRSFVGVEGVGTAGVLGFLGFKGLEVLWKTGVWRRVHGLGVGQLYVI